MGKTIRNVDMVRIHKNLKTAKFIGKVCVHLRLVLSLSLNFTEKFPHWRGSNCPSSLLLSVTLSLCHSDSYLCEDTNEFSFSQALLQSRVTFNLNILIPCKTTYFRFRLLQLNSRCEHSQSH